MNKDYIKYIKYKNKYLKLKYNMHGGAKKNKIIYETIFNSGGPTKEQFSNGQKFSQQCMWISILDYLKTSEYRKYAFTKSLTIPNTIKNMIESVAFDFESNKTTMCNLEFLYSETADPKHLSLMLNILFKYNLSLQIVNVHPKTKIHLHDYPKLNSNGLNKIKIARLNDHFELIIGESTVEVEVDVADKEEKNDESLKIYDNIISQYTQLIKDNKSNKYNDIIERTKTIIDLIKSKADKLFINILKIDLDKIIKEEQIRTTILKELNDKLLSLNIKYKKELDELYAQNKITETKIKKEIAAKNLNHGAAEMELVYALSNMELSIEILRNNYVKELLIITEQLEIYK